MAISEILTQLKDERSKIEAAIAALEGLTGLNPQPEPPSPARRASGKRILSAAARKRISDAAKARWARVKGTATAKAATPATAPKRRRLSKEGRARIIAATKARWARVRAGKK